MNGQTTFGGWQREQVGLFFGLDGLQVGALAGAAVAVLAVLLVKSLALGALLVPLAVLLAMAALVRVQGRAPVQWARTLAAHELVKARGAHRFRSEPRWQFAYTDDDEDEILPGEDPADEWDLPGILAPLRLLTVETAGGPVGVIHHRARNTYTVLAEVQHPGIALVAADKAQGRVQGWASWLAQQCTEDGRICRVGAFHVAEPAEVDELASWIESHTSDDAPPQVVDQLRSILAADRRKVAEHRSYLTVTLSGARSRREIKAAGGGDAGACAVLVRRMGVVASTVRGGGVDVERWLAPREVAATIRLAFAPASRREIRGRELAARRPGYGGPPTGVPPAQAGPAAAETSWSAYRHDGSWSIVAEIEWPRTPRDATMLAGLLRASSLGRRSVAVHYEPVATREAERTLTLAKTKRDVAVNLRAKTGQIPPERERRELATAIAQDKELAAGHGLLRFCGLVSVTVDDPERLEDAWDELCADAGATGLVLRRCHGWMDAAFVAAAVPVGMGLPSRGGRS